MHIPRKAEMHMSVILLTVNHTLALENDLLNIPCMVNLTALQLDQNILNSSRTLGALVYWMPPLNSSHIKF